MFGNHLHLNLQSQQLVLFRQKSGKGQQGVQDVEVSFHACSEGS